MGLYRQRLVAMKIHAAKKRQFQTCFYVSLLSTLKEAPTMFLAISITKKNPCASIPKVFEQMEMVKGYYAVNPKVGLPNSEKTSFVELVDKNISDQTQNVIDLFIAYFEPIIDELDTMFSDTETTEEMWPSWWGAAERHLFMEFASLECEIKHYKLRSMIRCIFTKLENWLINGTILGSGERPKIGDKPKVQRALSVGEKLSIIKNKSFKGYNDLCEKY